MTDYIVVERSTTIEAPAERISPFIIDFHEWVDWSPWEGIDPNLERTYNGPDVGVGASYSWSGNRAAGAGTMQIESIDDSSIELALTFTKPFKSNSRTRFDLTPDGTGTAVTWQVLTPKTLLLRVMSLFMKLDKTVGPDLEKGLAQLKVVAEKLA